MSSLNNLDDWVIEPTQLAEQLDNNEHLLIIDLCNPKLYQQAHIPGAINVLSRELIAGISPAAGKLPPLERLEQLFSRIGYTGNDQHIVVYDDEGGGWAGRFIWTLDVIGHSNYAYLNGGIHAWAKAGLPLESQSYSQEPKEVSLAISKEVMASREYIEAKLGNPDVAIWDARSPAEYRGERLMAMRGGHIPGAVNYEWTRAMDPARDYRIREGIQQELETLGITKDKEIITHCQGHHRSGFTYLVAKALGYQKVKAYDGSWGEWGNLMDTPIETG